MGKKGAKLGIGLPPVHVLHILVVLHTVHGLGYNVPVVDILFIHIVGLKKGLFIHIVGLKKDIILYKIFICIKYITLILGVILRTFKI